MPLTKANGNMYLWVTHTHTHLGGECPHRCCYCYVQAMARRFGGDRYQGELRLIEKEFAVKYGTGKTVFVEHCNDLWADAVDAQWIGRVLRHCRQWPDNEYVFQTKNPARILRWLDDLPPKRLLGCTIETINDAVLGNISQAPSAAMRVEAMRNLSHRGERLFVTVEPILKGNMARLAKWIGHIRPEFVNIGADSKGTGLDEPSADDVRELLRELAQYGVEIRQKTNLSRLLAKEAGIDE